eukprot:TRINITY_DN35466_c2_g1_i6.p1 TRINITY_DN35466_c2_g1~~TRINITY_DN35466_c2_g1_i6.p1  ORF type:complete len:739 (+),score=110.53 TRINITY_DN35466_c2_g1_i6:3-2219(+)
MLKLRLHIVWQLNNRRQTFIILFSYTTPQCQLQLCFILLCSQFATRLKSVARSFLIISMLRQTHKLTNFILSQQTQHIKNIGILSLLSAKNWIVGNQLWLNQQRWQSYFSNQSNSVQYLRQLNQSRQYDQVVQAYEQGKVESNEGTLGEYIKALVHLDRLDNSALVRGLQRGTYNVNQQQQQQQQFSQQQVPYPMMVMPPPYQYYDQTKQSRSTDNQYGKGAESEFGTAKKPLYVVQTEQGYFPQFWRTVRQLGLVLLLISGVGVLMEDRGLPRGIIQNQEVKPQTSTDTKLDDVKGVDEAKDELQEVMDYLRDPHRFTKLGGKLPKGILLVGPPGTGKTMLARAVAGEAGVPFFYCSGSEFEEMFVGVGARRVRELFSAAKKSSPCIIFIDEIDAIGGSRNPKDQMYVKMTLNQLLVELDGFKANQGVIVIAATNFPESLDKALVRPGRFDRHIVVPAPDLRGRSEILKSQLQNIPKAADVKIDVIGRGTPGMSGADLANLVNIAALKAAREGRSTVDMASLEFAKERVLMGAERKSAQLSEDTRRLTAYHEGGHALVAMHTQGAIPVHKATILPRGSALGMVLQLPEKDEEMQSFKQLLARLDVAMGGRVAEELIFGQSEVTTGASSDLQQATRIATAMVTKYGFSSRLGKMAVEYDGPESVSANTKAVIEEEVKELLNAAYERAKRIIKENERVLHILAKELLEQETLSSQQIKDLIKRVKSDPTQSQQQQSSPA